MLVLSRQKNQRVTFPGLGITVEILDIRGSKVRVGVDAPMEVRILRDELPDHGNPAHGNQAAKSPKAGKQAAQQGQAPRTLHLPRSLRHELRNALHEASLMMHVYHKRMAKAPLADGAQPIEPDQMFEAILRRLEGLAEHKALSPPDQKRAKPDTPAAALTQNAPANSRGAGMGGALIVDDDANERELLAGFLRMCDYSVDTVADGQQALDYLRKEQTPGVILLDMGMPRCDGPQFLREFRGTPAFDKSSVFVVSGATPEEMGVSPDMGYTRWFDKPLNPCRVVEELRKVEGRVA